MDIQRLEYLQHWSDLVWVRSPVLLVVVADSNQYNCPAPAASQAQEEQWTVRACDNYREDYCAWRSDNEDQAVEACILLGNGGMGSSPHSVLALNGMATLSSWLKHNRHVLSKPKDQVSWIKLGTAAPRVSDLSLQT